MPTFLPMLPNLLLRFLFFTSIGLPVLGQNLVTNGSFETGASQPDGWALPYGFGQWEHFGLTGTRSVSLSNFNANCNGMQWRSSPFSVEPGRPLLVNGWMHSSNGAEVARAEFGLASAGNSSLALRYVFPPTDWRPFPFVTLLPRNQTNILMRFASCQGAGTLVLDDAEVYAATPVHTMADGSPLGVGEEVSQGKYSYTAVWRDVGQGYYLGNYARCFYDHNAILNTFYVWEMNSGAFMTFRHEFGGHTFTNATAKFSTGYNSGMLFIEFSVDGTNWLTSFTNSSPAGYNFLTNTVAAPTSLFPTTNLFVRMRVATGGYYRAYGYAFSADLSGVSTTALGGTLLMAERAASPLVRMESIDVGQSQSELGVALINTNSDPRDFIVAWQVAGPAGVVSHEQTNQVPAQATNQIVLPYVGVGPGENTLSVLVTDRTTGITNYFGSGMFRESILRDSSYGALLPGSAECAVWSCDASYKVGRDRLLPSITNSFAYMAAARNEYEAVQVVLRPQVVLSNATVSITDFVPLDASNSVPISATNVEICFVDYVPVTQPTDYSGVVGMHPDPLVPWTAPLDLPAGTNQPIWITVHVPKSPASGDYQATLSIQTSATTIHVPVKLHVFDFSLSDYTHTKWATRTGVNAYWHGNPSGSKELEIFDLYLQNFARHRVSIINPDLYAPLVWSLVSGSNGVNFTYNFSTFDAAIERYVNEFGFNCFNLPIVPTSLNGNPRFTPAYRALYKQLMAPIMAHIREQGWLEQAYCWWYDEPDPYTLTNLVVPGMQAVGEAAPGLRRQLTREPLPELYGLVDAWVPLTHWLDMSLVPQRKAFGEQLWWYLASVPAAPYVNWLTDHPANDARLRMWTGEKYGMEGEFYWNTIWWIGTTHAPISPWTNALSRLYEGLAVGNGGGVLLFPPTKTPPESPYVSGPINTLRWEMIREGIEDREYYWLLAELLKQRIPVLGTNHPAVVQAIATRESALSIILSRTYYDSDPQRLYAARLALAAAIEALDDGTPLVARQPNSRAVSLGGVGKLYAEAVGWPKPEFQWQHSGTNFPGATNAFLVVSNIAAEHLGEWQLIASNTSGSITSRVVRLGGYWINPPQIIAQSTGDNRRLGDRTVFDVTAVSALPMNYTWMLNGTPIVGATNPAIALTNLTLAQGGFYTVLVSNAAGVALSAPITLTLPLGISEHPVNQTVGSGSNATFSVTAYGAALGYQWFFDDAPLDPNVNASVLLLTNVQPPQAGSYFVVVTNSQGSVTSQVATLTVQPPSGGTPPFIAEHPTNRTVVLGENASFAVTTTGTEPMSYQWYFNGTNLLTNASASLLTLTNAQLANTGIYHVFVANAAGMATSAPALLEVMPNYVLEPPGLEPGWESGEFRLTLPPDNRPRTVLRSTNLLDWSPLFTVPPSGWPWLTNDSMSTNLPLRYYRVRTD